jgi:uncharacterized membrane-anchored protein YhcB (DUF1043 family)
MEYLIILIAGIIIGMLLYHIMQEIEEPKTNNEIKQIENDKNYMANIDAHVIDNEIRDMLRAGKP